MKKTTVPFFIIFFIGYVFGQEEKKNIFFIEGNGYYSHFSIKQKIYYQDTTWSPQQYNIIRDPENWLYLPTIGFNGGFLWQRRLSDKFSFRTGLTLFNYKEIRGSRDRKIIRERFSMLGFGTPALLGFRQKSFLIQGGFQIWHTAFFGKENNRSYFYFTNGFIAMPEFRTTYLIRLKDYFLNPYFTLTYSASPFYTMFYKVGIELSINKIYEK
jgi:hypothetical protein